MKNLFYTTCCKAITVLIFAVFSFFIGFAQPKLIGGTAKGGNGYGTIYSIQPGATTFSSNVKIEGIAGTNPVYTSLTLGTNGKYYGLCSSGGDIGDGVIFEYDVASNTYIEKVSLDYFTGGYAEGP
ncbi:MAG: hypothetical protein QM737_01000 [Ferruginibacter sp.]